MLDPTLKNDESLINFFHVNKTKQTTEYAFHC